MMNKWWASKITKKIIDQTVLATESRPISKYVAYIVNEFRHTLTIKDMKRFFKNSLNVVLNFEDKKEFQSSSFWNTSFDKAEHLDE